MQPPDSHKSGGCLFLLTCYKKGSLPNTIEQTPDNMVSKKMTIRI